MFAILTMGFSGLVAQMLLLRELFVVFSGNELSIGIVLANWLILEAAGCLIGGKTAERIRRRIETFALITILFSLSLPAAVYLTRVLKAIIGVSIGESIGFVPILYSSFLILLPVSVSHGALFTFNCKIFSMFMGNHASSIGKVYVYETMGTVLGGIVWTYFLIPYLNAFEMAVGLAMLNLLAVLAILAHNWKIGPQSKAITAISAALLIFAGYFFLANGVAKLHQRSINAQWPGHNLVHYQNSIYGNTAVIKSGEQYHFFSDGVLNLITPVPDIVFVEQFVHLPLLAHSNPRRLLVLSGGAGGIINEALKHPSIEVLDYAELDPLFLELVRKFPTPLTENELSHRKVAVQHIDGRLFLRTTRNTYDVILVGLLNPTDLQTNRFFTEEFFALAQGKLNAAGILVMGLPGSLSYVNDELKNLNACIYNTLTRVFPFVRVFPGDDTNLFLSSKSEEIFLLDRTRLANRVNDQGFPLHVPVPRHIDKKLHPGWQDWFARFLEGSTETINRDFKPLGMFYSIAHWNTLFAPYLRGLFRWFQKVTMPMLVGLFALGVVIFLLGRHQTRALLGSGIPLCIATTGFAGMIFDLALIFTFQSIFGYVFAWIGLLVTAFMAGTAAGAMVITSLLTRIAHYRKYFIHADVTIICFSLGLPFIFLGLQPYMDRPVSFLVLKILFLILSFVSGLLIGAQFPLANAIYLQDAASLSQTAGVLYSADLLGGWLGGIVGGVVLLPVLGLLGSCMVVVLLKLFSLIVLTAPAPATA